MRNLRLNLSHLEIFQVLNPKHKAHWGPVFSKQTQIRADKSSRYHQTCAVLINSRTASEDQTRARARFGGSQKKRGFKEL